MRGAKKKKLDLVEAERLASIQCTNEEIAFALGVSRQLVDLRIATDPKFKEALERGRAEGRRSLRRRQFEVAENPDAPQRVTMLIWLGKNLLGQTDKVENTVEIHDHRAVAEEVQQLLGELSARNPDDRALPAPVAEGRETESTPATRE